jgi:hypothetical protein
MRFLSIYKGVESNRPPSQETMERMNALIEKSMKSGELVTTEGCLPTALGARIRSDQGRVTVVDGPFAESKEVVGGFAILEAKSKDDAIRMVREFLVVAGDGECELRQIYTASEPGATDSCVQHEELTRQFSHSR